jgi:hypothetical protein
VERTPVTDDPPPPAHPTVEAVRHIHRDLGIFGTAVVLWTVVMACALLRADERALFIVWTDLYTTWLGLGASWLVAYFATLIFQKVHPRRTVSVAPPSTPRAPPTADP